MEGANGMEAQTMTKRERLAAIQKMYLNGTISEEVADRLEYFNK